MFCCSIAVFVLVNSIVWRIFVSNVFLSDGFVVLVILLICDLNSLFVSLLKFSITKLLVLLDNSKCLKASVADDNILLDLLYFSLIFSLMLSKVPVAIATDCALSTALFAFGFLFKYDLIFSLSSFSLILSLASDTFLLLGPCCSITVWRLFICSSITISSLSIAILLALAACSCCNLITFFVTISALAFVIGSLNWGKAYLTNDCA